MMYLYSGPTCPFSQMSRILLNEKGCEFEVKSVDLDGVVQNEEDLAVVRMSPYGELPVLTERDLLLYNVYVVNEYIDERFPHPQLMTRSAAPARVSSSMCSSANSSPT